MAARSWVKHRLWAHDAAGLALAALGVVLLALTDDDRATNPRDLDALGVGLLAGAFVLLALRRRAAGWVALAVLGLNAEWHALGYANPLIHVPTLVAFYALGTTGKRRQQLCFGAAAVLLLTVGIVGIGEAAWSDALDAVGWTVAAILFGEVVRGRRAELDTLADRAERAEAEQEAEAQRRVAAERLRLARELHDVLAHTVSVMTVQAAVAADRMERSPEAARAALDVVRAAGRDAMDEVRANVALLRESGSGPDPPAPGLARLDELVGTVSASGLDVDIIVEGVRRPLPALVELTGYRVAQEALTNVVRHAHASHCRLRLAYEPEALVVEVSDEGVGTGPASMSRPVANGFGLRGMAERVESIGGTLATGPKAGGGFEVRAALPVPPSSG